MSRAASRVAALVLLAVAVVAVLVLRAELMTSHATTPPGSVTQVVVQARTSRAPELLPQLTRGLVDVCRLAAGAREATPLQQLSRTRFAFTLRPALDAFDRRELKGCLQDLREEGLLVDVEQLRTVDG